MEERSIWISCALLYLLMVCIYDVIMIVFNWTKEILKVLYIKYCIVWCLLVCEVQRMLTFILNNKINNDLRYSYDRSKQTLFNTYIKLKI